MNNEIIIYSINELELYLDDINEYVNSILLYHYGYDKLDSDEILMYLSSVNEIIKAIKQFICD